MVLKAAREKGKPQGEVGSDSRWKELTSFSVSMIVFSGHETSVLR